MATKKWVLDPTHSELQFKVKHLMITNVTGSFSKFQVTAETEENDFTAAKIEFSADVNSISTGNEQRDGHLKSADFFEAEKFPAINFSSVKIDSVDSGSFKLNGNLTIKGITNPVVLLVDFGGVVKDPYGNTKAGFSLTGKINRKDFGLTWNALTEAGGVVVGDEIKILSELELAQS